MEKTVDEGGEERNKNVFASDTHVIRFLVCQQLTVLLEKNDCKEVIFLRIELPMKKELRLKRINR